MFEDLFSECRSAFKQDRTFNKARDLAFGIINCLGRQTITGFLTSSGKLFEDWSSAYRLFKKESMNVNGIFDVIINTVISEQLDEKAIYAHMDDTILKKTGRKVHGTAWRRDPLGPPFHTNFIWGQRFIQTSLSIPNNEGASPALSIPIDFHHAPTVKRPKKKDEQKLWDEYKEKQKIAKLSSIGSERIKVLREKLDEQNAQGRQLFLSVDSSYSNQTVLKNLPDRTTLIGRIRKDAVLNELPEQSEMAGRNRIYGKALPTPEEIRQSDEYSWQSVKAYAAGKVHDFDVKVIKNIRWRKSGKLNLQLVIIRPLAYRLTKNSKLLYRNPAYLICTNPELAIQQLLQAYLWRWGIEVDFREEKTIFGCGKAQVRTKDAVEKVPAFIVAIYALLKLSQHKVSKITSYDIMPRAKWYSIKKETLTTGDVINLIRTQIYAKCLKINFTNFTNVYHSMKSQKNMVIPTLSTVFFNRK